MTVVMLPILYYQTTTMMMFQNIYYEMVDDTNLSHQLAGLRWCDYLQLDSSTEFTRPAREAHRRAVQLVSSFNFLPSSTDQYMPILM